MEEKFILEKIEFNYIPCFNNEKKAARLYSEKTTRKQIIHILNLLKNNKYGLCYIDYINYKIYKDKFDQYQIVKIKSEDSIYMQNSYLIRIENIKCSNKKTIKTLGIFDIQSIYFKSINDDDKILVFKFKKDWLNSQGQIKKEYFEFYNNVLYKELKNNNLMLEIKSDNSIKIEKNKKNNYYVFKL